MESNPIQQRMEEFELKYIETSFIERYQFLVLRTPKEDLDMVDAFYEYMLGVDNEIEDVVVLFQSPLNEVKAYSQDLVEELFYTTFLWNYSKKPESIEENFIDWEMDMSLKEEKNMASLFVSNINTFCDSLEFEEGSNLVCVLDYQNSESNYILSWLKDLVKLELHPKVSIVLSDTIESPVFNELKDLAPSSTYILIHQFELNKAIKAIATIGDPIAPSTQFRKHYFNMLEEVGKQNEKQIYLSAKACLSIAKNHKDKDVNWFNQIVVVQMVLANYETSGKNYKQAIVHLDKGIQAASETVGVLPDEMSCRLMGQGYLFRGTLYRLLKKYSKAKEDFIKAEEFYGSIKDYPLQIESLRMLAHAAKKDWDSTTKYKALDKGVRLGKMLNVSMAEASSYAILVKAVLASKYYNYISDQELSEIVTPLFGEDWRRVIKSSLKVLGEEV